MHKSAGFASRCSLPTTNCSPTTAQLAGRLLAARVGCPGLVDFAPSAHRVLVGRPSCSVAGRLTSRWAAGLVCAYLCINPPCFGLGFHPRKALFARCWLWTWPVFTNLCKECPPLAPAHPATGPAGWFCMGAKSGRLAAILHNSVEWAGLDCAHSCSCSSPWPALILQNSVVFTSTVRAGHTVLVGLNPTQLCSICLGCARWARRPGLPYEKFAYPPGRVRPLGSESQAGGLGAAAPSPDEHPRGSVRGAAPSLP